MINKIKTDYMSFVLIIGFFIFILEISFFDSGLIFSLLIFGLFMYFGRKKWNWLMGKVLFAIGLMAIFFTIVSSFTFHFLLLALIIYFIMKYAQSKQRPAYVKPEIHPPDTREKVLKSEQKWLQNKWFGSQKTPDHSYTWDDVNIQCGVGDTIVDLGYTVLPKGEAVIFIRNIVGNIHILIPYEVEISVYHSVMAGSTTILEEEESKMWNQTTHFQTPGYENASHKVKIITSIFVGSLEVKRV